MRISKFLAAAAVTSLVATPLMAQSSASKLSVARAAATLDDASSQDDEGSGSGIVIGLAAAVAVGAGIYFAVDGGDDDDLPSSP